MNETKSYDSVWDAIADTPEEVSLPLPDVSLG